MKKNIIIITLLLTASLTLSGCLGAKDKTVDKTSTNKPTVGTENPEPTTETPDTNTSDFLDGAVGEIIQIDGDEVHILVGDIADIAKVDKEDVKNFYLGETVRLTKNGDLYTLESYKQEDFTVRHTNMGNIIESVTGKIKGDVKDNKFILSTDDGDIPFEAYDEMMIQDGAIVTVDYIKMDPSSDTKTVIAVYNEDATLDLTINSIERTDAGMMVLNTKDAKELEYIVYVMAGTVLDFNYSDLKTGNQITVYPEVIRESYPAQVDAQRIKLSIK